MKVKRKQAKKASQSLVIPEDDEEKVYWKTSLMLFNVCTFLYAISD